MTLGRRSRWAFVVLLSLIAWPLADSHGSAQRRFSEPRSRRVGVQLGGSLMGTVQSEYDGHRVKSLDLTDLDSAVDVRPYLTWLPHSWFALTATGGVTSWQSLYLSQAGHGRSNFFPVGVGAEVRIPFGRCARCWSILAGPLLAVVLSQRDQRAPYASVRERGRLGWGGAWRAQFALDAPFHPRIGARFEVAYERTILHHDVHLSGIGQQHERYSLSRTAFTLGPWFSF